MINFCVWGAETLGISKLFKGEKPKSEISFFDVKELYNEAYEHKARARNALRQYRRIEAKAHAMDQAYRQQLGLARRAA